MILIATLTVRRAAAEEFRRFEREAARIMEKHGGAIERVIALRPAGEGELFRELHVVSFPSDEAFAAYRHDPELLAQGSLRDFAIAKTEVLFGDEAAGYHAVA
jgi:uncharacterized protein (DUF1330 family)